jgi:hypothetical protein
MATRGPRTFYRPKERPSESALLTPLAKRILYSAAHRCDASRSDIFETLLRLHGGELKRDLFRDVDESNGVSR